MNSNSIAKNKFKEIYEKEKKDVACAFFKINDRWESASKNKETRKDSMSAFRNSDAIMKIN